MNWTENTPINITNLNNLEIRINAANTNVVAGKDDIYNAIVAKKVNPISKAFASLVSAINAIPLGSGNAQKTDVRLGKTFTNSTGIEQTGTYTPVVDDLTFTAGNNELYRVTTKGEEYTSMETVATKLHEVVVKIAGTYRVKFSLKAGNTAIPTFGRIYKNGVAYGTTREWNDTYYKEFSEDLTFAKNDLLQYYGWRDSRAFPDYKDVIISVNEPTIFVTNK